MVITSRFHFFNRDSGMVKYLDGLRSKTFKDEPRGWESRIDISDLVGRALKTLRVFKAMVGNFKKKLYDVFTLLWLPFFVSTQLV